MKVTVENFKKDSKVVLSNDWSHPNNFNSIIESETRYNKGLNKVGTLTKIYYLGKIKKEEKACVSVLWPNEFDVTNYYIREIEYQENPIEEIKTELDNLIKEKMKKS